MSTDDRRDLDASRIQRTEAAQKTVFAFGKAGREQRLQADYSGQRVLSARAYNALLVGTVMWGLWLSAVLCLLVGNVYERVDPALFLILYLGLCIGGCVLANKSSNPWLSFLGFNMVSVPMGLLAGTAASVYLEADPEIVIYALLYTALITTGMLASALAFPTFFSRLGGVLAGCLTGLVLCELVLLLFGVDQNVTDWLVAGLFSLYIGYDVYRSQQFEKTADNAVDCALDLYMDIINLFVRILRLLARSRSRD